MKDEIANLVHPVFTYGLRLQERLKRGETPDFFDEQAALKGLLMSEMESRRYADFGGEGGGGRSMEVSRPAGARHSPDQFLGIRYSLACWLDEIFICDSSWDKQWNEHKIEEALYGSNDRAWSFWEQAQLAEARTGIDALEVMFLCVVLGFRGDLRDKPDKLKAWVERTGARIAREQGKEWPMPPELEPPTNVPPLRGRERLHRMVLAVAFFVFGLVPLVAYFLVTQMLGR